MKLLKNKQIEYKVECSGPVGSGGLWIVLTHGVGNDMYALQLSVISQMLVDKGFTVVRFTCIGCTIPCWKAAFLAVLKRLEDKYKPDYIIIGGCSKAARVAAILASEITNEVIANKLRAVLCFSYPLHSINDKTKLRDAPLRKLRIPVFFFNQEKDKNCNRGVLERILSESRCMYEVCWIKKTVGGKIGKVEKLTSVPYKKAFERVSKWCLQCCRMIIYDYVGWG